MPVYRRHPFSRAKKQPAFWLIYLLSIIFTYHALLVAYNSSTYMEQFAPTSIVSVLYIVGSVLSILAFVSISKILHKIGNVRLAMYLTAIKILALILVGAAPSTEMVIIAFIVHLIIDPILYFNIDIFSESLVGDDERSTGSKRGLALALMSVASILGPLTLVFIVGEDSTRLDLTYFASAAALLPFAALIYFQFRYFKDPQYKTLKLKRAVISFWRDRDLKLVFFAHLILQIFFAWAVIYLPLYMATKVGLSWADIGSIVAFALLAYAILEYPIGIFADKYIGEKEMMVVGFVILAVSSSWISFMATAPVLSWMILMFINRIGAALVEVTTESYFFKHTEGSDANIISFFRLTRPLSIVLGSILGSISLFFLPFELAFIVLGFLMVIGALFASRITDTK